jgi:hypothetical protein
MLRRLLHVSAFRARRRRLEGKQLGGQRLDSRNEPFGRVGRLLPRLLVVSLPLPPQLFLILLPLLPQLLLILVPLFPELLLFFF